ncbi:hypothetical protein G7Y89_g500 [Cudoniella acicularis]|uniref:Plasma membrane fusion protein PRM1 n=1 Tax=Cudoniella acicularis TaxID=354080 RepID=A0A8H4WB45_9HELO|nr:hypothetical protein G7Y89_g500 [Cudoniella acicularis]
MSSARNQEPPSYPTVPPSLNAGSYEMQNYQSNEPAPPNTLPIYTPYLGLRARLSQTWINRWTILLLLIIVRVLLAIKGVNQDIASAKEEALSACTTVENVGSAMASMPHYLADGVNAMAADGITKAVGGLMDMLTLTLTSLEEIILFLINMYTSTYVCLITLAVSGSLHVAIDMIEKVGSAMNASISTITGDISTDVTSFQNDLNTFLGALSIPTGLLGGSKTPPQINITDKLASLNDIQIDPTTMDADLTKLNNSIPTFADVQNFTRNVVSIPFDEIKQLINESMSNYTFDKSVFPVPEKKALTFCSNNSDINDFFGGLVKVISTARTIFIIVALLAAILVCIPMGWLEIWRWRKLQLRARSVQKNALDPIDVVYIASRPVTANAGIMVASRIKNQKRKTLFRWFVAYSTTLPALVVLALGMAGLANCLCQYLVLRTLEREVPVIAQEVEGFADKVVDAINNSSESWALGANRVINSTNIKVNEDVFGWVNTSTTAVNNTLNTFVDEMNTELNNTFGGTILYAPIQGVMNCLVELKIAGIEKGLTWVQDHAHVDLPEFRSDVFSLGAAISLTNSSTAESFLSSPGSTAGDDVTNAVEKVAAKLMDSIKTEAIISACVVAVFFINMFIGLIRVIYVSFKHDKTRAEGGPAFTGDNRGALSPRSPNRNNVATFPDFGGPVSSLHQEKSVEDMSWEASGLEDEERLGSVEQHRSVEFKPGHERASSYGYLDEKSRW